MQALFDKSKIPRLLYLSDVPVEATYHGSLLIYRLLTDWPCDKLQIIETNLLRSLPSKRLPAVTYKSLYLGNPTLYHTRFQSLYGSYIFLTIESYINKVLAFSGNFEPEAIITVAHGFSWLLAARYAEIKKIPLHIICHDDLPSQIKVIPRLISRVTDTFGKVYRQAESRFCVSSFMEETYERLYHATGTVLYALRSKNAPDYKQPPERLSGSSEKPFTVVFAGTVNSLGYVKALTALAEVLSQMGGRLYIYGPLETDKAAEFGLLKPNIFLKGLIQSPELLMCLRQEADVLFVPMSFDLDDKVNMEIAFPSKLSDYTSVGIPLLIYGPPYCSAVRWAKSNSGAAVIAESESELIAVIQKLSRDQHYRIMLGKAALATGQQYFSWEAVTATFYSKICP